MKKQFKVYMHGDSNDGEYYNEECELGLDENSNEYKNNFKRFTYEVQLDVEVDTKTCIPQIIGVKGVKLEKPVLF